MNTGCCTPKERNAATAIFSNKDYNQRILIQRVAELLESNEKIFLAGHFCIINKLGKIEELPSYVFDEISLEKIILLEAPAETIITHLNVRDGKCYSQDLIQSMLITEREAAQDASERLGIPLIKYEMQYSEGRINKVYVVPLLKGEMENV